MSPSSPSPVAVDPFVRDRLPARAQWPQLRYDLPELQLPDRLNLVERLLDGAIAKGWGDRPMLRSPQIVLTYADAKERVDRIAQVLVEDLRLVPGQRVLLRGGNSIGMALAWLAVVKAGLVAVATMPLLRARELVTIIDKARITHALCDARLAEELARLTSHLTELEFLLGRGEASAAKKNNSSGSVGKRLDFLFQEMNREANTLGSKAGSLEMTQAAIDLKLLIEQMREQAMNIE